MRRTSPCGDGDLRHRALASYPACQFDAGCVPAVRNAARALGLRHMDIVRGAGRDAIYLARIAPAGMVFVPCERGISHNETQIASPEALAGGCNVLLKVVLERAQRRAPGHS